MRRRLPLSETLQETLQHLPLQPGVYLMKSAAGEILYVGKAKQLRHRVRSYFRLSGISSARIASMIPQIADIEYIVTDSELEALILEATLIKKHKPPYNVVLKDDKNFPYIKLTVNEMYPRILTVRTIKRDGAMYFGPYVHPYDLRKTLKVLMRFFPLRHCSGNPDGRTRKERPCFQYEIHRCLAPCAGKCTPEEYMQSVEDVILFLQGKKEDLLHELRQRMEHHAERLEFEQAAVLRDQIEAVERIMERQKMISTQFENQDVIATARKGPQINVQIFFIRNGMLMGRKSFHFSERVEGSDTRVEELHEREVLRAFVEQFYLKDVLIPDEILLSEAIPHQSMIAEWLSEKKGKKVALLVPQRGKKKHLIALVQQNAELALTEIAEHDAAAFQAVLEDVQQQLQLTRLPGHIECFDISNIQGTLAVGSMVVCRHGLMEPKAYKRFKIKTIEGSDDFAMLYEVITRRYARVQREGLPLPDLIMVDGGKGQLHAARAALAALRIDAVDVVGLAKARGARGSDTDQERVFTETNGEGIVLDTTTKSAQLLQHIRDEAHRFALTYHRTLRKKANFHSILEEIPGVGQKRRKRLLTRFGSLKRLKEASIDEIAVIPSINADLAETIYTFLHTSDQEAEHGTS
ncbi:excinuclease ABC subunit UvrC [candidate division KSB3 bacterium]|uniref:UvrABC system protein C n=1 Tax=candidate division KSB3 bacterium TaxID=2044937 RepID=A0A9D5K0U9_9BACT|nr:excinuclease ABC subunit UvrC [candidate division KSB3 bacterium]MBD3327292.1 excinuclease ABC subunit UvrC [candidate division KSB3 bacterium]